MRVGFLHLDLQGQPEARALAEIMVRSVKSAMPNAEIVHMADPSTPKVRGVDTVIRREIKAPWIMHYRLDHLRHFPEGDAMFIDTDAVVQRDTSGVFDKPFDVALTRRRGPILVDGKDIVPEMPFNSGVMFSRSMEFWEDVYAHCDTLSEKLKHWFGDQVALKVVAESGKYKVLDLTCDEYNYSPNRIDEDVSQKYIVHMKGKRKQWMLHKFAKKKEAA
jgi:hypothetical protein